MDDRTLHHPNDRLFKSVFSSPFNAAGLLKHHLPPALSALIQSESLSVENPSFLDPSLANLESDLFLKVGLCGHDAFLFVLLEHQSSPDTRLPLRILGYIVRVWERFARENPSTPRLPPVFPFLIAQTDRAWSGPTRLLDLIDIPQDLKELLHDHQPQLRIHTLDLFTTPYERLGGTPDGRLALRALKAKPVQALLSDEVWDACESEGVSGDVLTSFLLYTLDAEKDDERVLNRAKQSRSKAMHTESMSALEKLIHRGRSEGFVEGHSEGFVEGRSEGFIEGQRNAAREGILDVLSIRFGPLPCEIQALLKSRRYDDRLPQIREFAKSSQSLADFTKALGQ